jgi:hypothetical protein
VKTIIAGSRNIVEYQALLDAIEASGFEITEVVSGGARGVDSLGERYAKEKGISLKIFPADWESHGRKAGIMRNTEMAHYADALIAVWDGLIFNNIPTTSNNRFHCFAPSSIESKSITV